MSTRKLKRPAIRQRDRPHEVHVHLHEVRSRARRRSGTGTRASGRLAGPFAGSRSNPASTLNQRSSVGLSLGDVVEVAVEEDVAPREERARLVFERAADLPAAENRAQHARGSRTSGPGRTEVRPGRWP